MILIDTNIRSIHTSAGSISLHNKPTTIATKSILDVVGNEILQQCWWYFLHHRTNSHMWRNTIRVGYYETK